LNLFPSFSLFVLFIRKKGLHIFQDPKVACKASILKQKAIHIQYENHPQNLQDQKKNNKNSHYPKNSLNETIFKALKRHLHTLKDLYVSFTPNAQEIACKNKIAFFFLAFLPKKPFQAKR